MVREKENRVIGTDVLDGGWIAAQEADDSVEVRTSASGGGEVVHTKEQEGLEGQGVRVWGQRGTVIVGGEFEMGGDEFDEGLGIEEALMRNAVIERVHAKGSLGVGGNLRK